MFNLSQTTQTTFNGVNIYASPQMGLTNDYNDQLNVLNSNFAIKPGSGRLMSLNADGVHLPDSRGGVWIENSVFQGQSDDAVNSLPYAFSVQTVPSTRSFTVKTINAAGNGVNNTSVLQCAVGDHLTFFDMVNGVILGRAKVTAVTGTTTLTITIDQDISGVVPMVGGSLGTDPKSYTLIYDTDFNSN